MPEYFLFQASICSSSACRVPCGMNTIGRSMDDLFWWLPVMAYLWVVCAALVPIFVLGGSRGRGRGRRGAGNKGHEASPFCIWSNHTPFPFHHFTQSLLGYYIFQCFDKVFSQLNPLFHQLSLTSTFTTSTHWKLTIGERKNYS